MAAVVSLIGAICSALRGSDTVEGRHLSKVESIEAGIAGAGEEVMAEVGAGSPVES
jgi:hypothetical protein